MGCPPSAWAAHRHPCVSIDNGDPSFLAILPRVAPPPRWGERDMAELRYTEANHDSTHHLPADDARAPSRAELSHDQRAEAHPIGWSRAPDHLASGR